jgi:hypothetical protein
MAGNASSRLCVRWISLLTAAYLLTYIASGTPFLRWRNPLWLLMIDTLYHTHVIHPSMNPAPTRGRNTEGLSASSIAPSRIVILTKNTKTTPFTDPGRNQARKPPRCPDVAPVGRSAKMRLRKHGRKQLRNLLSKMAGYIASKPAGYTIGQITRQPASNMNSLQPSKTPGQPGQPASRTIRLPHSRLNSPRPSKMSGRGPRRTIGQPHCKMARQRPSKMNSLQLSKTHGQHPRQAIGQPHCKMARQRPSKTPGQPGQPASRMVRRLLSRMVGLHKDLTQEL